MYYFYLLKLYLKYYQLFSLVFQTDQKIDDNFQFLMKQYYMSKQTYFFDIFSMKNDTHEVKLTLTPMPNIAQVVLVVLKN